MPELPEVETIASELNARLTGRGIEGVEVLWPRTVGHPAPEEFASAVSGARVAGVGRRGKFILVRLAGGGQIAIHLRMTGRLTIEPAQAPRDPYTRLALRLDGSDELRFADVRKFGRFYLVPAGQTLPLRSFAALGPEPLDGDFTPDLFAARVAGRRGNVKAALLDQRLVAGLGNIYADEALFRAGIHPRRTLASLDADEIRALHDAIVLVLKQAIGQGGTSFRDYRTTWGRTGGYQEELSVFRKAGTPCPACGSPIERDVVAGRGTYYCPECQKSG
jgi:formamidopyrimidine-DNA glycosylase